jgi:hypothetical protein
MLVGRGDLDGGETSGAVPVDGHARDLDHPLGDGNVPGDDPSAVEALTQHDVVDVPGVERGPAEGLPHHHLGQVEGRRLGQAPAEGGSDRRSAGGQDHGISHRHSSAGRRKVGRCISWR